VTLGPAPVLALIVGLVHTSIYVLIRGSAGDRLPVLIAAAFLGAWAGDALGGRLGIDPLVVGDFHLIAASLVAWLGLIVVGLVAVLGPDGRPRSGRPRGTVVTRTVWPPSGPEDE
jgi:hypothetical protein